MDDIIQNIIHHLKETRLAYGVVDDCTIQMEMGPEVSNNVIGYLLTVTARKGTQGRVGKKVFLDRAKAEEYFEELKKKYELEEL